MCSIFFQSVSLRKSFLTAWNSSTANQIFHFKVFKALTHGTKWITPSQWAWKSVPKNGVGICVYYCLWPLEPCYTIFDPSKWRISQLNLGHALQPVAARAFSSKMKLQYPTTTNHKLLTTFPTRILSMTLSMQVKRGLSLQVNKWILSLKLVFEN